VPQVRKKPAWGDGFGERLRVAIDRMGKQRGEAVEQQEVAGRLGVDETTISTWTSGGIPFAWDRLRKLCEITGASADSLLGLASSATQAAPPMDPAAPVPQEWIPLVADVAAGEPMLAPRDEAEDWYAFKSRWIRSVAKRSGTPLERFFAVKVARGERGLSMLPAIRPGASLVIDPGPEETGIVEIEDARIYLCRPSGGDGGLTIKRAWLAGNNRYLVLKGDNPARGAIVEDMKGRALREVIVGRVVYIGQEEE
jgi:transcriptional regulator with XRE-family HTH domain